jgi:archaellum component FlaG (FlaF/FlaG flagellin family)
LAIFVAAILIAASVAGLRPVRVAHFEVEKVPNPTSATLPPMLR